MRGSSRRASRNKTIAQFGLIAFVVLVAVIILPGFFSMLATAIMSPFYTVEEWISTSGDSFPLYWRDRTVLIDEIKGLKAEIAENQTSSLTIRRLQDENATFRELLGASKNERILASVVARPNRLPYDVIQLDRGSDDGVVLDAPIFLGVDQVVGQITHVTSKYSFATLVSSPNFLSTVYIIGPNIYTPAEGIGGGLLRVRVPQGIELSEGNMVVLPAIQSGVFGEIVRTETIPTQPEQYGYVSTGVPLQSLRFVTIGRTPLSEQTFEAAEENVEEIKTQLFTISVPAGQLVDTSSSSQDVATSTSSSTP